MIPITVASKVPVQFRSLLHRWHWGGAGSVLRWGGLVALGLNLASLVQAEAPRALPDGELPKDQRLQPPKDLDGYFPFVPSANPQEWAQRAEAIRHQIQVAMGLWPMPIKTPLNPVVHGRIDRADYTVEKVFFESVPGFFVTGSLYRPKNQVGLRPAVLCPHGHWNDGRFLDSGREHVRQEIVNGAERFEE